jgi:hypothetical protein
VFWHLENRKSSQALVAHACLEEILSQKIGLMEWLKVKVLSSSPSTAKKKKGKRKSYTCSFPLSVSVQVQRSTFGISLG